MLVMDAGINIGPSTLGEPEVENTMPCAGGTRHGRIQLSVHLGTFRDKQARVNRKLRSALDPDISRRTWIVPRRKPLENLSGSILFFRLKNEASPATAPFAGHPGRASEMLSHHWPNRRKCDEEDLGQAANVPGRGGI
jgi:hypothetical protein